MLTCPWLHSFSEDLRLFDRVMVWELGDFSTEILRLPIIIFKNPTGFFSFISFNSSWLREALEEKLSWGVGAAAAAAKGGSLAASSAVFENLVNRSQCIFPSMIFWRLDNFVFFLRNVTLFWIFLGGSVGVSFFRFEKHLPQYPSPCLHGWNLEFWSRKMCNKEKCAMRLFLKKVW